MLTEYTCSMRSLSSQQSLGIDFTYLLWGCTVRHLKFEVMALFLPCWWVWGHTGSILLHLLMAEPSRYLHSSLPVVQNIEKEHVSHSGTVKGTCYVFEWTTIYSGHGIYDKKKGLTLALLFEYSGKESTTQLRIKCHYKSSYGSGQWVNHKATEWLST